MAFVKATPEFVLAKIEHLKSEIKLKTAQLDVWNANRALQLLDQDVYVNRQEDSFTTEKGVVPDCVKHPCRFASREEIEEKLIASQKLVVVYEFFLDAIDRGDFLMVDDDNDKNGQPGYQLFRKECPSIDVLKTLESIEAQERS